MAVSECFCCGGQYHRKWEEAFDKFGFGDGDGQVETAVVEGVLAEAGYEVQSDVWGMHNIVIRSIRKGLSDLMPGDDSKFIVGYDDPREYAWHSPCTSDYYRFALESPAMEFIDGRKVRYVNA